MENNKKGMLVVASLSLLSVGLVLGLSQRGSTTTYNYVGAANAQSKDIFTQDHEGAHLGGNQVYFVDSSSESWWGNNDAKTAFYFFTEKSGNKVEAWSSDVLATPSWTRDYDDEVYEAIVPDVPSNGWGITAWDYVIAVRMPKEKTVGTFDDRYNQSGNMAIGTSGNNAIFLSEYGESYSIDALTATERLEILSWAQKWSKPAGSAEADFCDAQGNTNVSTLKTQWDATGAAFDDLGADVKYVFSHAIAVADDGTSTTASLGDFAARYDWVFYRYSESCSLLNWGDRTINF